MKTLKAVLIISLILFSTVFVLAQPRQKIRLSIDSILTNDRIIGTVVGISLKDYSKYKIIVYVYTDKWYIHPYAGQGEGKSWASIGQNGKWEIETVQREYSADRIAALIVKRNYPEPSTVSNLTRIQNVAFIIRNLRGTADHGKL